MKGPLRNGPLQAPWTGWQEYMTRGETLPQQLANSRVSTSEACP